MTMERKEKFECPHCKITIFVEALNCRIFRCGIKKSNGTQIDPHLKQTSCEYLYNNGLIYGCGKPFTVIPNETSKNEDDKFIAIICDYI